MKVLLSSRYFLYPSCNGASQLSRRMAAALSSIGHEVRVVCLRPDSDSLNPGGKEEPVRESIQDGIHVTSFAPFEPPFCDERPLAEFRPDFLRAQWAARVLNKWVPDVVHVTASSGLHDLLHEAIKFRIPVIATLLDFSLICPSMFLLKGNGQLCEGNPNHWKCRQCLKYGTSSLSRIACLSSTSALGRFLLNNIYGKSRSARFDFHRAIKESLFDNKQLRDNISRFIAPAPVARIFFESHGVPSEKIVDLVYSLPEEKLKKSPREPLPSGKGRGVRIGFIGRPSREKGFHIALDAFLRLNGSGEPLPELWLAGNGMTSDKVAEYSPNSSKTRELINQGIIKLFNSLNEQDLTNLMANIDVCLIPSICYECTPLVLLEVLAQGTPCIGSDTDGIRHLIIEGKSGRVFSIGNAKALALILHNLIKNPKQMAEWGKNLPSIQDDMTYAQKLTRIYENTITSCHNL